MTPRLRPSVDSLAAAATPHPRTWDALVALHDAALAAAAFPVSAAVHRAARDVLARVESIVRHLPARERALGADSGIDGTTTCHRFAFGIAEWLAAHAGADAEIDWRDPGAAEAVESLIGPVLSRAEEDGFASEELTTREWIGLARGTAWPTDLAWVLTQFRHHGETPAERAARWDAAGVPIRWTLRRAGSACARLPVREPTVRRHLRALTRPPQEQILRPARGLRLLGHTAACRAIHVAREILASRCREVHAITYANPAEVWHASTGSGTALLLFGVRPEFRLLLEANYGFVLVANGIPVGYGGVSPLFRQANTGINIFAPFRGTEAPVLWVRALQWFHQLFSVTRFVVNPYQIGGDNAEAIASGAYWFYDRLGFRPADDEPRALADRERAHRQRDPRHRSDRATLRALATADLHLTLPGFRPEDAFDERWIPALSLEASTVLAAEGHVSRAVARQRVAARMADVLHAHPGVWSAAERHAFAELAPLAALIPDLADWPLPARRSLAAMLRAKGAPGERGYARAAGAQVRFFRALGARLGAASATHALTPAAASSAPAGRTPH